MKGKAGTPFAASLQLVLVLVMLGSFFLIAQQWSKLVYQIGLLLLVASALVQVVFGNVAPEAGFARSMKQLALGLVVGIALTPLLVKLGR